MLPIPVIPNEAKGQEWNPNKVEVWRLEAENHATLPALVDRPENLVSGAGIRPIHLHSKLSYVSPRGPGLRASRLWQKYVAAQAVLCTGVPACDGAVCSHGRVGYVCL